MWSDWVVPRLRERGLGRATAAVTLRTTGLGESLIAERLGPLLDRDANPTVATYARADAVDIRISAVPSSEADAATLVAAAEAAVLHLVGDHVWGRGEQTWAEAIAGELARRGSKVAIVEVGTRGAVLALLGEGLGARIAFAEALPEGHKPADGSRLDLEALADQVRAAGGCDVGLAVGARQRGSDLSVTVAVADPEGRHQERRVAFLGGQMGRARAALIAAAVLHARLRSTGGGAS
jgi:nicotinamide-nucleotide amidase